MIKATALPRIKINFEKVLGAVHTFKKINKKNIVYFGISFAMSVSKVMGAMSPFGAGFFASVCNAKNLIPSLLGVSLGSILTHQSAISLCYVITAAFMACLTIFLDKPLKTYTKASILGCVLFTTKTVACFFDGLLIYDMLTNLFEAFVASVTVMACDKAVPILFNKTKRNCLSLEETVSLVALLSMMLLSFNLLPTIYDVKVGNVLAISVILIINLYATVPAGTVCATVIGVVNSIDTYNAGSIIGAYAFSSLISSLFRKYGKTGVVLSFIMSNAIITIFLNGSTEVLINVYEILWASVIVFALPKKFADRISKFSGITSGQVFYDNETTSNTYQQQIGKIAESVSILSNSFTPASKDEIAKKEINALINRTAQKTCSDCSLRFCCWQKKGDETKNSILSMLSAAQSHGKAYINNIDTQLKSRCIRLENLLASFNDSFEFYRMNIMWQKRLLDSKNLSCMQLKSVSGILDSLSKERHRMADGDTLSKIKTSLDSKGIVPQEINAYFKEKGNFIVELIFNPENYREDTKFISAPCLSEALGVKMRFNEIRHEINHVMLSYSMSERFTVSCACTCTKKHGEQVCGDSFTTANLSKGNFIACISDGMGSGEMAAERSKRSIDLLKNFLQCGFEPMQATRLLNSHLSFSFNDEIFSTVDLCSINLHTGIADFIKTGSASTYIKTVGGIEKLSSDTLPAGVLANIKPKHFSKKLDKDTLIIMVSDGVENASADDKWLEKKLSGISSSNPHVIADKILELSLYQCNGKAKDDMTVIAIKIFEENNV